MIRTVAGYSILACAVLLAAFGLSYHFAQPPLQEELVEVTGTASDVSESQTTRRGREIKIVEFTVDGKRFSCRQGKGDYTRLANAVKTGEPLAIGIAPSGSDAMVGEMTRYYRIRQEDRILVPYDVMREQFFEGRLAILFGTLGVAACMCVPAYQLTFGRLSAKSIANQR